MFSSFPDICGRVHGFLRLPHLYTYTICYHSNNFVYDFLRHNHRLLCYVPISIPSHPFHGTMDAAASVIAIVQITEQVLRLCYKYAKGVKDAPDDIQRLQGELQSLNYILEGAKPLLEGSHKEKLKTSQLLRESLAGCRTEVNNLQAKLETKSAGVHRHLFNPKRLKWPLESKEVDMAVQILHKHRDNLTASLTIDQT